MSGAAYDDDRRVVSLWLRKDRDLGEERIIVRVSVAEPIKKPKKSRRKAA